MFSLYIFFLSYNDLRILRQSPRVLVAGQAEIVKYATGCDILLPSTTTITQLSAKETLKPKKRKSKKSNYNNRIATIKALQNDMKLGTVIKFSENLEIDVLVIQEVR